MDTLLVVALQLLPVPVLLVLFGNYSFGELRICQIPDSFASLLAFLNINIFVTRWMIQLAIQGSFECHELWTQMAYWMAPLLDILGGIRMILSDTQRPNKWRGRVYDNKV